MAGFLLFSLGGASIGSIRWKNEMKMTKIKIETDCGNSPKREFLKKFNVAFPNGNIDFIMEHISEDIRWEMVGHKICTGKDEILKELNAGKKTAMTEFELSSIITHGKEGSASGEFILASGKKFKFCDVYKFHGTKAIIKEMRSFVIEIK